MKKQKRQSIMKEKFAHTGGKKSNFKKKNKDLKKKSKSGKQKAKKEK